MDDESHHRGQNPGENTEPKPPLHTDTPDLDESLGRAKPLLKEVAETFDELAEAINNTPSPALTKLPSVPVPPEDLPGVHGHILHMPKLTIFVPSTDPASIAKLATVSWVLITLLLLSLQSVGIISI